MNEITENPSENYNCHGRNLLENYLSEHFDRSLITKFDALTSLYMQINAVINISALKSPDDIYIKHYLDSVVAHNFFEGNCCDVGCGGGFPCIPLAIVKPQSRFLGIDGVGKKLKLIKNCIDQLDLLNINSLHTRAEILSQTGTRFDTVCARAVADIDKVLIYCAPLCKPNGRIILYKTQNDEKASTKIIAKLKCELSEINDYTLPGTEFNRRLFVYVKR